MDSKLFCLIMWVVAGVANLVVNVGGGKSKWVSYWITYAALMIYVVLDFFGAIG
jgi:hypothetical protein